MATLQPWRLKTGNIGASGSLHDECQVLSFWKWWKANKISYHWMMKVNRSGLCCSTFRFTNQKCNPLTNGAPRPPVSHPTEPNGQLTDRVRGKAECAHQLIHLHGHHPPGLKRSQNLGNCPSGGRGQGLQTRNYTSLGICFHRHGAAGVRNIMMAE